MVVSSFWVGLLAALCTCTGLALVRRLPPGPRPRGLLTMGAAGLVLFVLIDVGYQALGTVELAAVSDDVAATALSGVLLLGGLLLGLVGLAWIESRRGHPGASRPQALDVAIMLAVGIGLRTFAEGLAVGQSLATSLVGSGVWLVLGLALHALLYGAAVAAPVAGEPMPPSRVFLLGACAAGPSLFGTVVGTTWVGPGLELLVLSIAAGALIYVLRELLRAPLSEVTAVAAMWALAAGLLVGLGTEMLVNAGRQGSAIGAMSLGAEVLAAPAQPRGRLRPPAAAPCAPDDLTSYTGRVTKYTVAVGQTTIVIATDEQTTETVTLRHPHAKDASAFYLIGQEKLTPEAWARIEVTPGTLAKGQRATAWVCTNGKAIVDWERTGIDD